MLGRWVGGAIPRLTASAQRRGQGQAQGDAQAVGQQVDPFGAAVGREVKNAPGDLDIAGFSARMRPIRRALLVVAFGVLPAIGFIAGWWLSK